MCSKPSVSVSMLNTSSVYWAYIGIWSNLLWEASSVDMHSLKTLAGRVGVGSQAVRRSEKSYSFMCGDGGTLAIGESFSTYVPKWFSHHFLSDFPWWHFVVIKFFLVQVEYTVIQGCQGTLKLWFCFFSSVFQDLVKSFLFLKRGMVK